MYEVAYERPASLQEAVRVVKATGGRPLAGGQSLVGSMKLRLADHGTVVDLGAIAELRGIRREGDALVVGAMTRHAEVADSEVVRSTIPALARLADGIGDRQVRNMGTIGGALANSDPAACYPAAVLALGASIQTTERTIAADDFFRGMYETALKDGELITAVRLPIPAAAAYLKFEQPASRFALVGVCVARNGATVRVGVTGAKACAFRCTELERALQASFTPQAARAVRVPADDLLSDLHATAEYRAHLIPVIGSRAVARALGQD
jgi:carbon-monoxide dehydrogenase medium subunit